MATPSRDDLLKRIQRGERMDRADLRGVDLSRAKLAHCTFDRADLDGANLEGADLTGATLRRATLREAYLVGANLTSANFETADLEGANLERANLAGANLARANLEAAMLSNADLTGAQLSYAQLATARLGGAKLDNAVLTHAELDDAYLGGATAFGARFEFATLVHANLEDAKLGTAIFDDAALRNVNLSNADLVGASLVKADLSEADLTAADFGMADIRFAKFSRAKLIGTNLTGAKIAGIIGTGTPLDNVEVLWLDLSPAGDGSQRVENGVIPALLSGGALAVPAVKEDARNRYFGRGDILRDAELSFDDGARVEIDSLFQNCTIRIGAATQLIVGVSGVLADCQIVGAGTVTVNGKFFERESPGIIGLKQLSVSQRGVVQSSVAHSPERTQFAFESGCQLRLKIIGPVTATSTRKSKVKP
jgi:uncharacterized protein YjbI with pentapeptide repeats